MKKAIFYDENVVNHCPPDNALALFFNLSTNKRTFSIKFLLLLQINVDPEIAFVDNCHRSLKYYFNRMAINIYDYIP